MTMGGLVCQLLSPDNKNHRLLISSLVIMGWDGISDLATKFCNEALFTSPHCLPPHNTHIIYSEHVPQHHNIISWTCCCKTKWRDSKYNSRQKNCWGKQLSTPLNVAFHHRMNFQTSHKYASSMYGAACNTTISIIVLPCPMNVPCIAVYLVN